MTGSIKDYSLIATAWLGPVFLIGAATALIVPHCQETNFRNNRVEPVRKVLREVDSINALNPDALSRAVIASGSEEIREDLNALTADSNISKIRTFTRDTSKAGLELRAAKNALAYSADSLLSEAQNLNSAAKDSVAAATGRIERANEISNYRTMALELAKDSTFVKTFIQIAEKNQALPGKVQNKPLGTQNKAPVRR